MANIYSVNSVGGSIMQFLRNAYPQELREAHPCDFRIVSSGEHTSYTYSLNPNYKSMKKYLREDFWLEEN